VSRGDELRDRVRQLCLAYPEVVEEPSGIQSNFRVRGKSLAYYMDNHHGDGRLALWCKAPAGAQAILVGSDPERYFVPPYVGHNGWVGLRLDRPVDWSEVADLIDDAYRLVAPRRLLAQLDRG
jgi:hypothetical protein